MPWNTIGCPSLKTGVFGRILVKKEKIAGILGVIEEKSRGKQSFFVRSRSTVLLCLFFPAVQPGLFQSPFPEPLNTAVKTDPVVAGDCPTTRSALPLLRFFLQERISSPIFDECQVFEHAHMIPFMVAFVQGHQPFTGKFWTLVTERHLTFGEQPALLF
jgi:hypothetical protein